MYLCTRLPLKHTNSQLLTPPSCRVPSKLAVVSHPLHLDVISVKSAAGKSVVMADSGAGLLAVTDLEPGTRAATGANVISSSRVERTVITTLRSAVAVARVFQKGR